MNKAIAGIATVTFGALVLTGCGGGSQGNSAHVKLMPVTTDTRGAVAHAQALQHEQAVVKAQARAAAHAEVVKAQALARAVAHQRAVVHAQAVARQTRVDAARAQQRAAQKAKSNCLNSGGEWVISSQSCSHAGLKRQNATEKKIKKSPKSSKCPSGYSLIVGTGCLPDSYLNAGNY
jgi:hypothetical protein